MKPRVVLLLCLLSAKARAANDVPASFNVGEVSKDGHIIHNRLTFDCHSSSPKEIDCVIVQQDLQEPKTPSKEDIDHAISEIGDVLKMCHESLSRFKIGEPKHETEFRENVKTACREKDRAALTGLIRSRFELDGQTCKLMSIVFHYTFMKATNDKWISVPDQGICPNFAVTRTILRDPRSRSNWNYTEVTTAKPAPAATALLCNATSGTAEFTWSKAFTAYELKCRYVEM